MEENEEETKGGRKKWEIENKRGTGRVKEDEGGKITKSQKGGTE